MREKLTAGEFRVSKENHVQKQALRISMKMPRNPGERQRLLRKLRKAVRAQIELWDLAASIAEATDAELDPVLEFCQATAIHADTGMELGQTDLQDLLDCLAGTLTAKIWVGKPLEHN